MGTETDGSVVCPSSANGIVGIKPTLGLISRSGIIPIAHSQDTAGPMARTVRDAAILLSALAGADPRDSATAASTGKIAADYTRFLDPNGLRGARIGVARKYFGFSDSVDDLMSNVMEEMKRQGAVLVDPADLEISRQVRRQRISGAALRIESRSQRLSGSPSRRRSPFAERHHRVQRTQQRERDALLRCRTFSSRPRPRAR